MNDQYIGREFHRKSALDANKDQKNASKLLKESTKGESLKEWFDKEKKKPAPKAEDSKSEEILRRNVMKELGISGAPNSAELAEIKRVMEQKTKAHKLGVIAPPKGSN